MKALNNTKRTRFKLTVYSLALLILALFLSIHKELGDVAAALCVPISAVLSFYMYGETNRSSKTDSQN